MAQVADLWLLRAASERTNTGRHNWAVPTHLDQVQLPTATGIDLAERVRGVLEATNLSAEQLILELAETWFDQELAQGIRVLEQLKDLGVGLRYTISGPAIRRSPTCASFPSTF